MKPILLVLLLLPVLSNLFAQKALYVDGAHGNNNNNGLSPATAWKTIQKAADSAKPGSTVYIKKGVYREKIEVHVSGTPRAHITFKNYNNDTVYIDGNGFGPNSILLYIKDRSYLDFVSLTLRTLTGNNSQGVLLECSKNGAMGNISFKKIRITNIKWTASADSIPRASNNAQGFIAYGYGATQANAMRNVTLDSCEVYKNITGFSEAVSFDGNIDTITVTNCTIHDNTNIGILIGGNYKVSKTPALDHARHAVVRNNLCYKNVSRYATSGGIYVDGGWNTLVERNTCYGNGYGIEVGCEENGTTDSITVRDNLIYQNQESGMQIGGYTKQTSGQVLNSAFENNTFYQNNTAKTGTGEFELSKLSNCRLINNIFFTDNQSTLFTIDNITPQNNNTVNYNCWYTAKGNANNININWRNTSFTTFTKYQSTTSWDSLSLFANPLFTNATNKNFAILTGSPCINKGIPGYAASPGEKDFAGNKRVKGRIDIGAYEFQDTGLIEGEILAGQSNIVIENTTVQVYPNPAHSQVYIKHPVSNVAAQLLVIDAAGKPANTYIVSPAADKTVIDISHLPGGVYFVSYSSGHATATSKFIKQ